jgi:outer membrane protein TolC
VNIGSVKSGHKPTVQVFAGYGWMNNSFSTDADNGLDGWNASAQLPWN